MTSPITAVIEHDDFVIINKPSGITMHDHLSGIIPLAQDALNENKLYLVHRLDEVTSGCLLLAKNTRAASTFSQMFAHRQMQKYYLALSSKKPSKKQGTISGDMINRRRGQHALLKTMNNPAITQFFNMGLPPLGRLSIVKPYTGKTHQIRVALKSLGSPIIGDNRYGGVTADRTYLHAWGLSFRYQEHLFEAYCAPMEGELFKTTIFSQWLAEQGKGSQLPWPALPPALKRLNNYDH
jgi:tRNA pseudouridine32 synthase/23S rRNA pseudouridine746 synthase